MKPIGIALLLAFSVTACGENSPASQGTSSVASQPAPKPPVTKADWKRAFEDTVKNFELAPVQDSNSNGIFQYYVSIPAATRSQAYAQHDIFKSLYTFEMPLQRLAELSFEYNHDLMLLGSYISLIECDLPSIFLTLKYSNKNNWIYAKLIDFATNNQAVLNKELNYASAVRVVLKSYKKEEIHTLLTTSDIDRLRGFVTGENPLVRVTGNDGYNMMEKKDISVFISTAKDIINIYDTLTAALKDKIPAECK